MCFTLAPLRKPSSCSTCNLTCTFYETDNESRYLHVSTESWALLIDWLIVCCFLSRFTHIGSHHFQWRVVIKPISTIYFLSKTIKCWLCIIPLSFNSFVKDFKIKGYHVSSRTVQMYSVLFPVTCMCLITSGFYCVFGLKNFLLSTSKKWT